MLVLGILVLLAGLSLYAIIRVARLAGQLGDAIEDAVNTVDAIRHGGDCL